MNDSHRFLRIVVKSFLMQGVSAIGLKLLVFLGFLLAEPLWMNRMTPTFQAAGTEPEDQHALKRSRRAAARDGQRFKIV